MEKERSEAFVSNDECAMALSKTNEIFHNMWKDFEQLVGVVDALIGNAHLIPPSSQYLKGEIVSLKRLIQNVKGWIVNFPSIRQMRLLFVKVKRAKTFQQCASAMGELSKISNTFNGCVTRSLESINQAEKSIKRIRRILRKKIKKMGRDCQDNYKQICSIKDQVLAMQKEKKGSAPFLSNFQDTLSLILKGAESWQHFSVFPKTFSEADKLAHEVKIHHFFYMQAHKSRNERMDCQSTFKFMTELYGII